MGCAGLSIEEDKVIASINSNPTKAIGKDLSDATVSSGAFNMEFSEEDLKGPAFPILKEKWVGQYSIFEDCQFIWDKNNNIGYPVAGAPQKPEDDIEDNAIEYYYDGILQKLTLEKKIKVQDLVEIISGVKGGDVYKTTSGVYFIILKRNKAYCNDSIYNNINSLAKPKEIQKFILPFKVTFTHREDMLVNEEQFPDHTEVTEKELQEYLLNLYEEYTEDKTEFLYFKADNVVEARIKSAKRG